MNKDTRKRRGALFATSLLLLYTVLGGAAVAVTNEALYTSGATLQTDSGASVTLDSDVNMPAQPFLDDETVTIPHRGNVSEGPGHVRVTSWNGTVEVTDIEGAGTVFVAPEGAGDARGVGGDLGTASWGADSEVEADDGTADISYSSTSTGTIGLTGLKTNADYRLVDENGNTLAVSRTDGSGTLIATAPAGNNDVFVQTFQSDSPSISDGTPNGSRTIDGTPVTLAANVSDGNFGTGDNVTLVWRVDGSVVNRDNITSDGRYSYQLSPSELPDVGGSTWSLTAIDSTDNRVSDTFELLIPATLEIRNESATSQIVNDTQVNVSIYNADSDLVLQRTTNDGRVNLTALPSGPLELEVNASGYNDRAVVLESLVTQQNVFLLPNATNRTVVTRFRVEDRTGNFGNDASVVLTKPIEINGTTKYRRVAGGEVGVEGFTTTLSQGDRYRVRVLNNQGDVRQLGAYRAEVSETIVLTIKASSYEFAEEGGTIRYDATVEGNETKTAVFNYSDSGTTDRLRVQIYPDDNPTEPIFDERYYRVQNVTVREDLPADAANETYIVDFTADRGDGDVAAQIAIGDEREDILPELDPLWKQTISVGLIIILAGLFGGVRAEIGVVAVPFLGGLFWFIGWLPPTVGGGAIVASLLVGLFIRFRSVR